MEVVVVVVQREMLEAMVMFCLSDDKDVCSSLCLCVFCTMKEDLSLFIRFIITPITSD